MTTAIVAPCHILPGSGFCQKQDSLLKRAIALLWHDGTGANAQVVELLKMPRNTARSPLEGSWKLVGEWHVQCCALKRETCLFQSQLEGKPVEELCCTHWPGPCLRCRCGRCLPSVCQALHQQTLLKEIRCNF